MSPLNNFTLAHDILKNANIGLWAIEIDDGALPRMYADDTMLRLLGVEKKLTPEQLYSAWYDNVHPDHYGAVADGVDKMISGAHAEIQYPWFLHGEEIRVRCGGMRNYEYTKGVRLEGCHQIVTELLHIQKNRKAELEQTENFLSAEIITAIGDAYESIYYVDVKDDKFLSFKRTDYLKSAYHDVGIPFSKALGDYIERDVAPEDREKMRAYISPEYIAEQLKTKTRIDVSYRDTHTGAPLYYEMRIVRPRAYEKNGNIILCFINRQETAERENKRREQLKRNYDIIEVLASEYTSVYYVDLTTGELKPYIMNEETEDQVGDLFINDMLYSEAFKLYVNSLVFSEDREMMLKAGSVENIRNELSGKKAFTTTYRSDNNGDPHYCEMRFVKVGDEDSAPRAVALGFADKDDELREKIEQRNTLDKALADAEAANIAKTTFLFNMSHDIRTPMNAIIGFTNMAQKHIDDTEKVVDCLEKVESSSQHLLSLINDVLDMSRIESGKIIIEEKPVSVKSCTEDLYDMIAPSAKDKGIDLYFDFAGSIEHDRVFCDELRVNRVLINILNNAVKYTNPGGRITYEIHEIPCERDGYSRLKFDITDNGIGMSKEFMSHLFEAFAREQSSTVSGIQGTGLGLAITKELVELMGGKISVQSELGKGTAVSIVFDFRNVEAVVNTETDEACGDVAVLNGKRVLLVEDNELNREIAKDILEEYGMQVEEAEDGIYAVQKCVDMIEKGLEYYYDIILMDIQMPIMNGYKATSEIRSLADPYNTHIPIVAMTANAFAEDKQRAFEAGMDDHLAKPINIDELVRVLTKFVK